MGCVNTKCSIIIYRLDEAAEIGGGGGGRSRTTQAAQGNAKVLLKNIRGKLKGDGSRIECDDDLK